MSNKLKKYYVSVGCVIIRPTREYYGTTAFVIDLPEISEKNINKSIEIIMDEFLKIELHRIRGAHILSWSEIKK